MMSNTTISNPLLCTLLTPPGFGGIALIRTKGNGSLDLLSQVFTSVSKLPIDSLISHHIYLGEIREADQIIDQVMVVVDKDNSIFDIHCHGGPRIVQRIFMLLSNLGVEVANWKDATPCDSIEQEVLHYLSLCKSEIAVKTIAAQRRSGVYSWCQDMLQAIDSQRLTLDELKLRASSLLPSVDVSRKLLCPPKVLIVGPPNAGKSSLANVLTGRNQSLVSELPGTTRDWTTEFTEMGGIAVELIDTAGRRESCDQLENVSLERLSSLVSEAQLFILLIPSDYPGDLEGLYRDQMHALPQDANVISVISKIDLDVTVIDKIASHITISSKNETGISELKKIIASRLWFDNSFDYTQPILFTTRQQGLISKAFKASNEPEFLLYIQKLVGDTRV